LQRNLYIFGSDYILSLVAENFEAILPIIFPALYSAAKNHWNTSIRTMATNSLQILLNIDEKEFNKVVQEYNENVEKEKDKTQDIMNLWKKITSGEERNFSDFIFPTIRYIPNLDVNDPILSDSSESLIEDNRAFKGKELLPMDPTTLNALLDHRISSPSSESDDSEDESGSSGSQ